MIVDSNDFEGVFNRPMPVQLKELYENRSFGANTPLLFEFSNKGFIVELQYFLSIKDVKEIDIENSRFAFAVNSDGREMLIDLQHHDLPILQREGDDVDFINVTLDDLLDARISKL